MSALIESPRFWGCMAVIAGLLLALWLLSGCDLVGSAVMQATGSAMVQL